MDKTLIKQFDKVDIPYKSHYFDEYVNTKREIEPGIINYLRHRKSKHLAYFVFHKEERKYYITDRDENVIKILNEDFNIPTVITTDELGNTIVYKHCGVNPQNKLNFPVGICINTKGHVFVACQDRNNEINKGIFVFDSGLTQHLGTIGLNHNALKRPSNITIEDHENGFKLYVSDWFSSKITTWKVSYDGKKYEGKLLDSVRIINPSIMRIKNDKLFVVSECTWETVLERRSYGDKIYNLRLSQVKQMLTGLNAILVLNKNTLKEIKRLDLTNLGSENFSFIGPQGLVIDNKLNIYTTAYKLIGESIPAKNKKNEEEFEKKLWDASKSDDQIPDHDNRNQLTNLIGDYHSKYLNGKLYSKNMHLLIINSENPEMFNYRELPIEFIGDFSIFFHKDEENGPGNGDKIIFLSQRKDPAIHSIEISIGGTRNKKVEEDKKGRRIVIK